MTTQHDKTTASNADMHRTLKRLEALLLFAAIPRQLVIELTHAERAALIEESRFFFEPGLDREYPSIAQALVLMVEAIRIADGSM